MLTEEERLLKRLEWLKNRIEKASCWRYVDRYMKEVNNIKEKLKKYK